jgi:NitT/TauT family transport system permease protein
MAVLPVRAARGLDHPGDPSGRIGETSKIFLIFYTTVFLVVLNTWPGWPRWRNQNPLRAVLRSQPAATLPLGEPARHDVLRADGHAAGDGNSFAAVVGAEFIAAQGGLGFLILDSARGWPPTACSPGC